MGRKRRGEVGFGATRRVGFQPTMATAFGYQAAWLAPVQPYIQPQLPQFPDKCEIAEFASLALELM